MRHRLYKVIFFIFYSLVLFGSQVNSVLAVTFTAVSAKRDAPGPFAASPIVQGNADSSGTPDIVTFPRGTQISSDELFYANFDSSQGSIVFWITPEWNGNDNLEHSFVYLSYAALLYKNTNNQLVFQYRDSPNDFWAEATVDISSWTAGTTYSVVVSWDKDNTLDGSKYVRFSINDTHTFSSTRAGSVTFGIPFASMIIGASDSSTFPANALIEGLTIYRRPLWDGTYGINVGNGDEINQIYNAGSGKDPTLVTGSWDVVFALPTNSSTGSLSTGTGNAWSHPYSSNLLYTSTTNTGGFMLNGTYTSDGWANEGTPTAVAALATSEKIYPGGYKTTSDAANEGIYYDETVTAGDDWVVRALAHSDGTSQPKIILYDQTNGAEIGSFTGTTTSTRANPDVFIFTGEAPAGMTTLRVKLINTASSGTTYWHQVEVLSNSLTNPSFESGSGDPWIPTGWSNSSLEIGEGVQETLDVHSGSSAMKVLGSDVGDGDTFASSNVSNSAGTYISLGIAAKQISGSSMAIIVYQQEWTPQYTVPVNLTVALHTVVDTSNWKNFFAVVRDAGGGASRRLGAGSLYYPGNGEAYYDDAYHFVLNAVSLTITPASEANSTENTDEIRVDGRDTYTASSAEATSITTTTGYVSFNWRPRHAAADSVKFAETTSDDAYIVSFNGDANDYIYVYWDSANTITMSYNMNGTTGSDTWNATGSIAANTEYAVSVSYTGGSTMVLSIGGTDRITLSSIPAAFGTAPNNPVYFGSDTSSANQGDATFSSIVFDNTAPSISLTALSPDPNSDTTPALTGTATEAIGTVSNVQFQVDSTSGSWTACTADDGTFDEASEAFTCTVASALSQGAHTMYVRATDSNGNTTAGGSESSDTFTIDSVAPTISVTALTPDPTTDTTPSITGTATDATTALTAIQFQVDSTSGSWTACTANDGAIDETSEAYTCTTSALADGAHTIYIRATDSASNTTALADYGTDTFTVDSGGPTVTLTAISPDPTTDSTPTISGTASDSTSTVSTVEFQVDSTSGSWTACTANDGAFDEASETFSCTTAALADGSHTIYVRATDNASNTGSNASDTFTVDATGPTAPTLDSPEDNAYLNSQYPTFKFKKTTDATSSVDHYRVDIDLGSSTFTSFNIGGNISHTGSDSSTSTYTLDYSGDYISVTNKNSSYALTEGIHTWRVTAYDTGGNIAHSSRSFTVDLSSPSLEGLTLVDSLGEVDGYHIVSNSRPKVSGTLTDSVYPHKVIFNFYKENYFLGILTSTTLKRTESLTLQTSATDTRIPFTFTPSAGLEYGKYSLEVVGYDKAGNTATKTYKINILTDNKARELLRLHGETEKEEELKEKSQVSLPELEKKAKLRHELQAQELASFTQRFEPVKNFLANLAGSIRYKGRAFAELVSSAFSQTRDFLAAVGKGVANFISSTAKGLASALGRGTSRVAFSITSIATSLASGFDDIAEAVGKAIVTAIPRPAKDVVYVALIKSLGGVSETISQSQESMRQRIKQNQEKTNQAITEGLQNSSQALANSLRGLSKLSQAMPQPSLPKLSLSLKSISQRLQESQEKTKAQIHDTHKGTSEGIGKVREGARMALVALRKPVEKGGNLFVRVAKGGRIALSTFHSYVFDPNPTKISNIVLEEVGPDYAIVSWETNHYTRNNKVNYGEDLRYGSEAWGEDGQKLHKVKLTNLNPGTKYFFEVMSQNKNYAYDAFYSFETLSE